MQKIMKKLAAFIISIFVFPALSCAEDSVFTDMKKHLSYLNQRQALISKNIANADTPGYKTLDLAPIKSQKSPRGISLAGTSPMHITHHKAGNNFQTVRDGSPDTAINGNDVVLEEEMVKMSQTDMEYQKTLSLMRQMTSLVKVAIGDQ